MYLCIWALVPYASAAIQSGDVDPAIPFSNFIKYRSPLFKEYQNTSGRGAQPRRLAGQCSNNFYNKPFFVSDMCSYLYLGICCFATTLFSSVAH